MADPGRWRLIDPGRRLLVSLAPEPWPVTDALQPATEVPVNSVLYRAGDLVSSLQYIEAGATIGSVVTATGHERAFAVRTAGWLLGANSAMLDAPQYASVTALAPCTIRGIARDAFLHLAGSDVRVAGWVARMAARDARAQTRLVALFGAGPEARLLWQFAAVARAGLIRLDDGGWQIAYPPTHEQLGQLIGTSRETATRLLGRVRERGLLRYTHRQYCIPARSPLLRALALDREAS